MGILSKPKAPTAPDPGQTAATQYGFNKDAAGDTLKMNSMDRSGPFGYSQFTRDSSGMPTGIQSGFGPGGLQTGFDTIAGNFANQAGGIPGSIDFSGIDVPGIMNAGMAGYDAYANPAMDRQLAEIRTRMAETGNPTGSEISSKGYGDIYDAANKSRTAYYGQLARDAPGMEQTLTGTRIAQGMAPGQLAGQGLGLMGAGLGLLPQAQQPQAQVGAPNYSQLVSDNYSNQMKQYNTDMQGYGNMIGSGLGLLGKGLTVPMTGGASLLGMGMSGLGGLFNNGGSLPWANSPNYNAYGSLNGGVGGIA